MVIQLIHLPEVMHGDVDIARFVVPWSPPVQVNLWLGWVAQPLDGGFSLTLQPDRLLCRLRCTMI